MSAVESHIPCILSPCELSLLPLPAPDSVWNAPTAEEWLKAVRQYQPMTLDEAMRRTFFLPTYGAFDELHEKSDTKYYNLLNQTVLGPFARVALVVTLLRGIMDIGEGKRDRGDWRDLTDLWLNCNWLRPGKKMLDSQGNDLGQVSEESLRERFASGLERVSSVVRRTGTRLMLVAPRMGFRSYLPQSRIGYIHCIARFIYVTTIWSVFFPRQKAQLLRR